RRATRTAATSSTPPCRRAWSSRARCSSCGAGSPSLANDLRATYRLQLGPGLTFADVRSLVSYLDRLGVSHVYLSPALQARSGSAHGYDVIDPTMISRELGGEDELRALAEVVGIVLD